MASSIFDDKSNSGIKVDLRAEAYDGKCPYLGMRHDPATCLGFPAAQNSCFRNEDPVEITLKMQSILCLTSQYESCAVYQQEPAPEEEKPANSSLVWVKRARPAAVIVPLILLLIAAFVWWPTPWTSIKENTGNAAPLQKNTTSIESPSTIESANMDQAADNALNQSSNNSFTGDFTDTQLDASTENSASPTVTPSAESTNPQPGGFRVHSYD